MNDIMEKQRSNSPEYQIDLNVELLLEKLLKGSLTDKELADFNHLLADRSRMMRPNATLKLRRRAA